MARDGVIIHIDGDDSGFRKSLSGIEGVAKKGLGVALKGIAAVGTGFTAASAAALKFSGDLEQNLGGAKAVFGDFADTIEEKADKAFKNMGLATSDYLATANKMGSLFKGAGFEVEESVNLTTEAMQRAADVASIMGIDTAWAMESIAGAAKGNFTMMDNLGVAMNDTTLNAYALEIGLGKTTQQMTNQEKVALAMEMFLDRTAYAAGNYARENETLAGALSTAKAALQNFMAGTGDIEDLEESLKNASDVIVENIQELAPKLAEGLIEIVRGLIPVIPDILVELLPSIIDTIEELFGAAIDAIPDIIDKLADGIGDAVPILKPVTSMLSYLAEHIEAVSAVAISGVAAVGTYKTALWGLAIIQQVTGWLNTTRTVMQGYTAAINANTGAMTRGITVNGLLISTMTPMQLLYGVLTGQIKLADAAQAKFNLTILKNPYVAVTALVVGLVAAVATYAKMHKSAAEEISESLDEIQKEYQESIKAAEEQITTSEAEGAQAEALKNRLYDLEGQIKSGTLTEEEAKQAQKEFNATAAELEKMIPGITDLLYDETGAINIQTGAVDALTKAYINLAIAKAKVNAYQTLLEEAFVTEAKNKEQQEQADANLKSIDEDRAHTSGIIDFLHDSWVTPITKGTALKAKEEADAAVLESGNEVTKQTALLTGALEEENTALEVYNGLLKQFGINADETNSKIISGNAARTQSAQNAAKEQEQILKEQAEREHNILQKAHERGEILDREYYTALAVIRNKYFEEGSEDWKEYTDEIYDHYADTLTKQKEAALEQLQEIQEAQRDLAEDLNTENTYTTHPVESSVGTEEYLVLGDMGRAADAAEEYSSLLDQVEEKRGELPAEVIKSLRGMSVEEGTKYAQALLNATDEQYEKYIDDLRREAEANAETAEKLYTDETNACVQAIEEVFGQVPEDFFDIGEEAALAFGDGLLQNLTAAMQRVKDALYAEMSDMGMNMAMAVSGGGAPTQSVSYEDNRTTNIYASDTSAHGIVEAQKQGEVYDQHTAPFGG